MQHQLFPGDMPANPLEKPGYRLDFHDEFDGDALDQTKWLPLYLPQWSSRAQSAPRYELRNTTLVLQITDDQQPWCPEFDSLNRCSSIQTGVFSGPVGSTLGQHRFSPRLVVREEQVSSRTYTPQYGYFELRAKGLSGSTSMVTLWMIGYEDRPERSAEIAVMEIRGASVTSERSRVGYGVHPWFDPSIRDEFFEEDLPIDATCFHIYAVEWKPDSVDFYVDNQKIRTIHQSPGYPLQFMLGIYELPGRVVAGEPLVSGEAYPKEFIVDYVRAYQPNRGYEAV